MEAREPALVKLLDQSFVERVRQAAALRLLRRLHRVTHRLPIRPRAVRKARVLVVAPHMDDEVIGPGGTLALHQELGSHVSAVFCAAGGDEEQDRTRKAEARAAADFMGFARVDWLDFPDGQISRHEPALGDRLAEIIREVEPEEIFCPHFADHHRDHSAVTMSLCRAMEQTGFRGEVWSYEVWSPLWPNVAVDITPVADRKRQAIALHASQVAGLHYIEGILGLNSYRGLRVYVRHAEAYFVASAKEFVALAGEMNRL